MAAPNDFTPRDFFQLAKEVAEHEAELRIRLAKAGVVERAQDADSKSRPGGR